MTFCWGSLAPSRKQRRSSGPDENAYEMNSNGSFRKKRRLSHMREAKQRGFLDMRSSSIRKRRNGEKPSRVRPAEISTERSDYKYPRALLRRNANPTSGDKKQSIEPSYYQRAISTSFQGIKQSFEGWQTTLAWRTPCTHSVN